MLLPDRFTKRLRRELSSRLPSESFHVRGLDGRPVGKIFGYVQERDEISQQDVNGLLQRDAIFHLQMGKLEIGNEFHVFVVWERLDTETFPRWLLHRLPPFSEWIARSFSADTINSSTREMVPGTAVEQKTQIYVTAERTTFNAQPDGLGTTARVLGFSKAIVPSQSTITSSIGSYRVVQCDAYGPWYRLSLEAL